MEANGPYLNFFFNPVAIVGSVLEQITREKFDYGKHPPTGKRVVIEFPAPNTNKPLHLGHVRNMLLGQSLTEILRACGHEVFPVNLNNDRGIHICKSMLAYQKWGNGAAPDVKSDHYVGNWYVKFSQEEKNNEDLNTEIATMLQMWEEGDPETRALWEKMNHWALDGFKETYKKFEIEFAKEYFESDIYQKGKDIISRGLQDGIFKQHDDGAIYAELEQFKLPNKVLLRADGTSIYMTQDLALAFQKKQDFNFDLSIFVVGNEQITHFQQLFKILELLGLEAQQFHLAYGMIELPEGKMKSREGRVVEADDIVTENIALAEKEIRKRYSDLSEEEIQNRAQVIGMTALRFFILKYDPTRNFVFNPDESISFEGETGPYILYAYARISSIFEKIQVRIPKKVNYSLLTHETEVALVQLLQKYPDIVREAGNSYKPHLVARYLLDIAQAFTRFYDACPVKDAEVPLRAARLALLRAMQVVLRNGLGLFHIHVLKKM
ncbi:MAG: arginyl-tRNA synthetase [Promethearchaeota archaeon CR_4]|nr:MAG: arginyl-tRNA synthetase [Candidatus Lokiarchaeota archaeon CR_4]